MSISVSFITLGCAKNEADSARMQQQLLTAGYELVDPSECADAVIINTCSFIQSAIEESLDVIFEVASENAVIDGKTKLIVCGCLPSRYGDSLSETLTEPDCFVTCSEEDSIVEILGSLFPDRSDTFDTLPSDKDAVAVLDQGPSVYVKISDGCDRFCSYCTIPFIRGRYHSFELASIIEEVAQHVACGAKEIVLIAQDSGLWGTDFDTPDSLSHLLSELALTFPDTWFRVMYLQPEGINDELLSVMARFDNICNYFDIPLQHCDSEIISSMNRKGSKQEYLDMVSFIRERIPDIALRTTLIVGYPGETEEQFEDLCDFVEQAEFDYVGIFTYSAEEGTRAAKFDNQIDEEVKLERFQLLRDLADSISTARIQERVGSTCNVVVLGSEEDGQLFGRAQCQAPEVDGVTYIENGSIGDIIPVRITDTLWYEMEGSRE